ncbi:MAG: hypothetical protein DI598_17505 [Pseudopedobacter saltans]|uniref:Uncharacterized protein n=1 Tax=Pseudopedobacter saltans TaxID=151895 RepID=A0A2W5EHG8_9SPHI|nr:MAG: hypothetical protein DI598_17505 [Pseudopedobacter saltans]
MNIDNLMDNIRSFFLEQYKGMNKDSSFISFEPIGTVIDPLDFAADNEDLSKIKATEQLSILGDRLSQIDEVYVPNTNRLSSSYETLIASAAFTDAKINAPDISPYMARFSESKSSALQKFQEAKKASIQTPEGSYLPVYSTPQNWYDTKGAFWLEKNFSVTEDKPTPTPSGDPVKKRIPIVWKNKIVIDQNLVKRISDISVKKKLNISPNVLKQITTVNESVTKPNDNTILNVKPIFNIKPNITPTTPIAKPTPTTNINTTRIPIKPLDIKNEPIKLDTIKLFKSKNFLTNVKLADRIKLTNVLAESETSNPVVTKGFSMSFKYSLIYLNRPWFDTSLFAYSKMWYCLTLKENFFSNGQNNETNQGLMKCIPTAMILIKDLKIKAAWSDDDKKNAENSMALGIFNIEDNNIVQNELSNPGMQVIGWVCDVLPRLPEISDPNFI